MTATYTENTGQPLISIICNTFNHEKYIADALNGFLMQKIDGIIELLLHDDASTDNTVQVVRSFEEKMPANFIFKPIYQQVNQYSQGKKIGINYQYNRAQGKYIALCEGDDYWTDPLKLQKQIDFLEANPDYSLCFHNAMVYHEDSGKQVLFKDDIETRDYTGTEILKKWTVPTASAVYRRGKEPVYKNLSNPNYVGGTDIILFLDIAEEGKIRAFSDVMSVYRIQETGLSFKKKTIEYQKRAISHNKEISKDFSGKYRKVQKPKIAEIYLRLSLRYLEKKDILKSCKAFLDAISTDPLVLFNILRRG